MEKTFKMNFKKRPSSFMAALRGILILNKRFNPDKPLPEINAFWKGVAINRDHLKKFNQICGFPGSDFMPFLYPFTLFFPMQMRILTHKKAPLTIFRTLNIRNKSVQRRRIRHDEILDIHTKSMGCRIVEKGLEMDISTIVESKGSAVWENLSTFYYRGKFGDTDRGFMPPKIDKISGPGELARWYLPDGIGYRFSKIIGDSNPIHYWRRYARLFGFKNHFAQPFLAIGRSMSSLPEIESDGGIEMNCFLKGQVYYDNDIFIKGKTDKFRNRFDIFCGDNALPSISVDIKALDGVLG